MHAEGGRLTLPGGDFPEGFFARADEEDDAAFYAVPRLVTHIDDDAIAAVGVLYEELGVDGDVLDLMSSWVSHFRTSPRHLRVLGMNAQELLANPLAAERIVHDLNADPRVPLPTESVDDVVCCASVDYLTRPVEVFRDVARVLRPGGRLVCTFSNRVFATKAIQGWLHGTDTDRCRIVVEYFRRSEAFESPAVARRTPPDHRGDPLFAVWATRAARAPGSSPRPLTEPHPSRLPADAPARADILARHRAALDAGEAGYLDPVTGLFVFTAAYLADRGTCCDSGCRHCPYI